MESWDTTVEICPVVINNKTHNSICISKIKFGFVNEEFKDFLLRIGFTGLVYNTNPNFGSWYESGLLHNIYGPAQTLEYNGRRSWYLEGKLHGSDSPVGCHQPTNRLVKEAIILSIEKQGKFGLDWYKILTKDGIVIMPDIPELLIK